MRNNLNLACVLIAPAAGKLLLLTFLLKFDTSNTAFANLYIIEAIALLLFSITYCSFDTFITRYWSSIQIQWVAIALKNAKLNALVCLFYMAIAIFFFLLGMPLLALILAIFNQFLTNLGRVIYAALRLENKLASLVTILLLNSLTSNAIFVGLYLSEVSNIFICYLISLVIGNLWFMIYFIARAISEKRQEVDLRSTEDLFAAFRKKNIFLELGSLIVQNAERGILFYFLPVSTVNLISQLSKFVTPLDLYSKFFKLISIHKILDFVNVNPVGNGTFLKSRLIFYVAGLPFILGLSLTLYFILELDVFGFFSLLLFVSAYFSYNTSFYYTIDLFKYDRLIYNVFSDAFAVFVLFSIFQYFGGSQVNILVVLSTKFAVSVVFRITAAQHLRRSQGD